MKVTIAIFAVLIVGSNAGLLDLLNPVTDATKAAAQAQALLDGLLNKIDLKGVDASSLISDQVKRVTDAIQGLEKAALGIAKSLPGASGLVAELEGVIDQVLKLVEGLLASLLGQVGSLLGLEIVPKGLTDVIKDLRSQINSLVTPLIDALKKNILSGAIKPECFTKEVPEITGNATAVVDGVVALIKCETDKLVKQVDAIVANITADLSGLTAGVENCGVDVDCTVELVGSDFTILYFK